MLFDFNVRFCSTRITSLTEWIYFIILKIYSNVKKLDFYAAIFNIMGKREISNITFYQLSLLYKQFSYMLKVSNVKI